MVRTHRMKSSMAWGPFTRRRAALPTTSAGFLAMIPRFASFPERPISMDACVLLLLIEGSIRKPENMQIVVPSEFVIVDTGCDEEMLEEMR